MSIRAIVLAGLLVAAAVALGRELIARDGAGAIEYVVGSALVAGLVFLALRVAIRARRSRLA